MSLFKERQANAKKVIALQNEIFSLKNQLSAATSAKEAEEKCALLQHEKSNLETKLISLMDEIKQLKADLKKSRSDVTRLTNKLASMQES